LQKLARLTGKGEDLLLCLLLFFMLLLACLQIGMRWTSGGLTWADQLLRHLVLWCGLLGGLKATGEGKHIALDFTTFLVPAVLRPWVTLLSDLFCTTAAGGLTFAAWLFLKSEMEFGGTGLFGLPSWVLNSVFLLTFSLMTLRYTIHSVLSGVACFSSGREKEGGNR
jgi:TRAP-type C4-dicarboxylate transport system permease small subunit